MLKDTSKQLTQVTDLKTANDHLRLTEKRLRDELVTLSDKLRASRADSQRKDSLITELRDKLNSLQDDLQEAKTLSAEVDRLKEMCRKLRLEAEIKENQVRSLKVKIEHQEGECEQLKGSKRAAEERGNE